jgi:glycosyltransferase involved in cell wall biosynthesis
MKRLLSLNNYHYRRGGADAVFLDHEAIFQQAGWQTAVFSMHHPRNLPSEWSSYFVDEIEFGQDYGFFDKLHKATKVIYSFEARAKLKRLLDTFKPDIAHVHSIYHHLSPAILPLLKKRGIPTVLTAHDLKLACPAYKMMNSSGICERCRMGNLLNVAIHKCIRDSFAASLVVAAESTLHGFLLTYRKTLDRVVVPSRFYGRKLVEWGWPQERIIYIPNFVGPVSENSRATPGDYLLYAGRLAPEKGLHTLIEAVARTGATLKIAGTGPSDTALRQRLSVRCQSRKAHEGGARHRPALGMV